MTKGQMTPFFARGQSACDESRSSREGRQRTREEEEKGEGVSAKPQFSEGFRLVTRMGGDSGVKGCQNGGGGGSRGFGQLEQLDFRFEGLPQNSADGLLDTQPTSLEERGKKKGGPKNQLRLDRAQK